ACGESPLPPKPPNHCAWAGGVKATAMAARTAPSAAARRAAPTSQRESRILPNMPIAQGLNAMGGGQPKAAVTRSYGPIARQKCQLEGRWVVTPANPSKRAQLRSGALPRAELVEDAGRREAVRDAADLGLEIADRRAGLGTEPAVRIAHVVAAAQQQFLQFQPLGTREHTLVARPVLHEGAGSAQTIGKVTDGQRISLGGIVFHDDAEIRQHQEAGPLDARRHQQKGAVIRPRKRLPVRTADAVALPVTDGHNPPMI